MAISKDEFFQELKVRESLVTNIFNQDRYRNSFQPDIIQEAVYLYLNRSAKRLRPGILLFSCGAVGGAEEQAILAAAAVEVYHTWTLVHDDIIDNDIKRRGLPTVHEAFREKAVNWGYSGQEATELGRSVAIITGDLQQAWANQLLLDSIQLGVPLPVILNLVQLLAGEVTARLLEGEALDVLFAKQKISQLSESDIIKMLELKTGILYEFAVVTGAAIGLGQTREQNQLITSLGTFARRCGLAFQLYDDVLGIIGDERLLGKPVGSDIREGKRTTIVLHAYQNAGSQERQFLNDMLGNPNASQKESAKVQQILIEFQGVNYTTELAESYISEAVKELDILPESRYKELLLAWAHYIVQRDY